MFCPFCGRQNKENAVFCDYCGKAMQKNPSLPNQPVSKKTKKPKIGLSYNAKRGIVTGVLVAVVVLVILLIYYPSIFPWN
jgi:uncharacterized membrane protein YvbJ